ncbi:endonuclease/exonuclease/phosphatase family protein [Ferruginibacter albus]|uniref:endonuclease/exonuclease/phosphatase family protein n=1 Tax=Ferruginibacter albus TaxID=2875540 RepID=UPI001CC52800|nr:endonuclease/exonuclease/phosphatase [Ferruginibacter albus]UAY52971.1 endonuclease/exonuclease/phosphatase [Ferruginibacter albus]
MRKIVYMTGIMLMVCLQGFAQQNKYRVSLVGFYNLENLFDTINDPFKNDDDFTPNGEYHYDTKIYYDKLDHLSSAISQIGTDVNPDGLAIMGCAEIEDSIVLHDLINRDKLKNRHLRFVHYESPDERGIDVGFIYNPKYFTVLYSAPFYVQMPGGAKDARHTRDVLYVKGILDGDTVHVFVNHWPSRVGGEERSRPARAVAAQVCKTRIDSILAIDPNSKIIAMGDLNDDPINYSVLKVMKAKADKEDVGLTDIYNPWINLYKKGIGTLGYQDSWDLFDQIMISGSWLNKNTSHYFYYNATIFNKEFLIDQTGKYKGYPKRTWTNGTTYNYGYSDHFPVYITLAKKAK